MRIVIGYESMYGNTHRVAEAVAEGLGAGHTVTIEPIDQVDASDPTLDVVIIGVPTHAHGLPRPSSRKAAVDSAQTKYDAHQLEPSAGQPGAREWLARLPEKVAFSGAAFDTRFRPPGWLVGHPARRIGRELRRRGARMLAPPESFFIDKHEQLIAGELDRARLWGENLRRLVESGSTAGRQH